MLIRGIYKAMLSIRSSIMTFSGISYRMGAMIIAEIGDFDRFGNADQISVVSFSTICVIIPIHDQINCQQASFTNAAAHS